MSAIKVALIDDSAVVRKHLAALLEGAGMEVIVTASDPLFAWPKLQANWPDVIVLDVEMPRQDGISFLTQLMQQRPTPVVMCSTLTEAGCDTTLQALAAGAVGFVTKPKLGLRDFLEDDSNGLIAAVKAAARANLGALVRSAASAQTPPVASGPGLVLPRSAQAVLPPAAMPLPPTPRADEAMSVTTDRVIAIGSSTGGVQTVEALLRQLPRQCPGILLVQHMPASFTSAFARRLDSLLEMEVLEAKDGDRVIDGRMLIAPGGRHMQLRRSGAQYLVEVRDGPLVNHHRPSVDVLFRSVAQAAGRNAVGVILTGMGDDGARGLLSMHRAGARTLAQDEASCVVYGMPRAAVEMGAVDESVGLAQMGAAIMDQLKAGGR